MSGLVSEMTQTNRAVSVAASKGIAFVQHFCELPHLKRKCGGAIITHTQTHIHKFDFFIGDDNFLIREINDLLSTFLPFYKHIIQICHLIFYITDYKEAN